MFKTEALIKWRMKWVDENRQSNKNEEIGRKKRIMHSWKYLSVRNIKEKKSMKYINRLWWRKQERTWRKKTKIRSKGRKNTFKEQTGGKWKWEIWKRWGKVPAECRPRGYSDALDFHKPDEHQGNSRMKSLTEHHVSPPDGGASIISGVVQHALMWWWTRTECLFLSGIICLTPICSAAHGASSTQLLTGTLQWGEMDRRQSPSNIRFNFLFKTWKDGFWIRHEWIPSNLKLQKSATGLCGCWRSLTFKGTPVQNAASSPSSVN